MTPEQPYLSKTFDFDGDAFRLLEPFRDEPHMFFLDSSQTDPHRGRYSFIGFDPFDVITPEGPGAMEVLRERWRKYTGPAPDRYRAPFTPLTAGLVGCLSYDQGLYGEKILRRSIDDLGLPEVCFGLYDVILTIDHLERKLHVTSTGLPEKPGPARMERARRRLDRVVSRVVPLLDNVIGRERIIDAPTELLLVAYECNFTKTQYLEAVRRALDHIGRGDIYQVNLSQRFRYDLSGGLAPLELYATLRDISPSPFGAYLDCGKFQLVSGSPERFLRLEGRKAQTRPMKGTRPRGDDDLRDQSLRLEILNSEKEKAELLMITDLERNDLGKVCDYGSVRVTQLRAIEEYRYVFQATSTVEGRLRADADCFDLIRACFPGGSITGCPKIRAMQIIEELEPTRRGMYTGALGYISFSGDMDLNILIRTALLRGNAVYFQVGGGIVADSVPEQEYEETLVKAKAMQHSLSRSGVLAKGASK